VPALDRDLVRAVNSGNCFALIGAGPSTELGVPDWEHLATDAIAFAESETHVSINDQCAPLLRKHDFPAVFSHIEAAIGREPLVAWLKSSLIPRQKWGHMYDLITAWPFACYLTTNFEDLLRDCLAQKGIPTSSRSNTRKDLSILRASSKDIVFKIHGDLSDPASLVLNQEDYNRFRTDPSTQYWREKIHAVLAMVDVVIIGYSASDPDFIDQLERAKDIASPDHPVFMFAADMLPEAITDYYQKYNIRIISYNNSDGTHRGLSRILARHDPFIAKRGSATIALQPVDPLAAELASSIYIFTHLRLLDTAPSSLQNAYAASVLRILSDETSGFSQIHALQAKLAKRVFVSSHVDPLAYEAALSLLHSQGYVTVSSDQSQVTLNQAGKDRLAVAQEERDHLRVRFESSASTFLAAEYPALASDQDARVIAAMQAGLSLAFHARGLEIARSVFMDEPIDVSDALDMLDTINRASSILRGLDEAAAFADLMLEIILRPSPPIREYLAAISQGFFAYHALGLEPRASTDRLNLACKKLWILDSSILIPLLANASTNHNFAVDLINRATTLGFRFATTESLFEEVREHAWFALSQFSDADPLSPLLMLAATGQGGFRPNLFVEGYTRWASSSGNPSLRAYFREFVGTTTPAQLLHALKKKLQDTGIRLMHFEDVPGFDQALYAERDTVLLPAIRQVRSEHGTYRSDEQCNAEAEVVLIARLVDAVFLSLSTVLNRLCELPRLLTWKPESLYRFLALFTTIMPGQDLLYESMIEDLYSAGLTVVDPPSLARFAGPAIRQARMQLETERSEYEETVGKDRFRDLIDAFDRTPDEQKPFYSMRFAFYVAAKEREKRKAAETAASIAVKAKDLTAKERSHYERLKSKAAERARKRQKKAQNRKSVHHKH